MGQVFSKLAEWKALPYQIIDSTKVADLIADKTTKLVEEAGISRGLAHAILLKNSWDNEAAMEALEDNTYIKKTFNYTIQQGKINKALAQQESEFTC